MRVITVVTNRLKYDFSKWIFSLTFLTGGKNIGLCMYIINCKVFKMHSVAIENCVIQKRIQYYSQDN